MCKGPLIKLSQFSPNTGFEPWHYFEVLTFDRFQINMYPKTAISTKVMRAYFLVIPANGKAVTTQLPACKALNELQENLNTKFLKEAFVLPPHTTTPFCLFYF